MSEPAHRVLVPCTYDDCGRHFSSVNEMLKHKANDIKHDYCARCDEDFENEESLLIHKLKSTKHIVCPICGEEFRSAGGRDGHIRRLHPADQEMVCPGPQCGMKFKRASALMAHIEKSQCRDITVVRLAQEQAKKAVIKQALSTGLGPSTSAKSGSSDADGTDAGGVSVCDLEYYNKEAIANQPTPEDSDAKLTGPGSLSLKHWPRLGEKMIVNRAGTDPIALSKSSQVNGPSKDAGKENNHTQPALRTLHQIWAQWKQSNVELEEFPKSHGSFGQGLPDPGQALQVLTSNWDPNTYFNSFTGLYECFCGRSFAEKSKFEEHMLRKWAGTGKMSCPGCCRVFKNTSALIAHCESATSRCRVSDGENYAQIIDEISGGIVQSVGYHEDGTMKYEAGKIELDKKTVVGPNLDNQKW